MNMCANIDEGKIKLEEAACGLCGSRYYGPYLASSDMRQHCTKTYNLVRCSQCGLVFLNPRPTEEAIMNYYLDNDAEKVPGRPRAHERFYFNLFRRIPGKKRGRLLDVGCGCGRYICVLRENGWDVKGVDVAYTDYGKRKLGLEIYEGSLPALGLPAESFDAVTFWWTLEHMFDPLSMLKEAFRITKKDGVVVVGVPNIDSLEAKVFGKYWFHLFLPKHLYHFSPATLTAMLKKAGFARVKIRFDMFSFGVIGSLQCLLNARGMRISLNNPVSYALSLPLDILQGLFKSGGLITAYAYKS